MRAVVCRDGELTVEQVPRPVAGRGQLVLDVLRTGICGSDLHARRHGDELADVAVASGYDGIFRPGEAVVFGHEFCGRVAAVGPGTRGLAPVGTRVVAMPLLRAGGGVQLTGLSPAAPGSLAEQVVVEESLTFAVPEHLPTDTAALTEPMAVALHAVRRGAVTRRQVAVVVGCGPVGLAVISVLKARGVRTVVASDFSPRRRELAARCGADVVVDPAADDPLTVRRKGHVARVDALLARAVGAMNGLRRLPSWERLWAVADRLGATGRPHPVVFECVGAPGVLDGLIASAPLSTTIVVVGVCMQPDTFRPAIASNKELDLRFAFGYDPGEFRKTLDLLASGRVSTDAVLTGTVGLDGVAAAFDTLGAADTHAKLLVDPSRTGAAIS